MNKNNSQNNSANNSREKAQMFVGGVSIAVNSLLFIVKLAAGLLTGSIALVADAWHTISDSLSSLIIIVAAKLAARKADKEHPFGHGRWELVASLIIAFLLAMIGYSFVTDSLERLQNRESVVYGTLAIVVTAVSILANEGLTQFSFYFGKKHKNSAIVADGWHHRTDALSSLAILIGIACSRLIPGLWWMDAVLGLVCAVMIFVATFGITKETINKILGEEPGDELITAITEEVRRIYEVDLQLHHVHLHNYINHKEMTLHIMLSGDMTIKRGHDIATEIENMIKDKFNAVATVHVDPLEENLEYIESTFS